MNIKLLLIVCMGLFMGGCGINSQAQQRNIDRWTLEHGGLLEDTRLTRVQAIGTGLAIHAKFLKLQFHVLKNNTLTAFSWPTGDIYISSRLADSVSDDELAAALAHEMGHLLAASERINSLSSHDSLFQIDVEKRADGIACRLLCAASRPASALQSLLAKVSSDTHDGELRRDLNERIACLERTADRSK